MCLSNRAQDAGGNGAIRKAGITQHGTQAMEMTAMECEK